ncbi:hypothetical protein CYLTODRAFT_422562 [Cylindrobasidium torrendii FP15055 ss-10]|uniref:HD domain-containing protein n=1 Tax=Cylindrobasidium torrendii FP15055 ss-10 TaxID=1314674 RepID=A0A0D7BA08_9AGAR|nr:hypothetical protein CYLTODRAFT_422562 [Cylindrobasidium torrendii FP15055 ss-10]
MATSATPNSTPRMPPPTTPRAAQRVPQSLKVPIHALEARLAKPIAGITFPSSPLLSATLEYVSRHSVPVALNHVIRCSYFALIIARKLPKLDGATPVLIVLATLMHDLGWDPTGALISPDKRYEVDGANAARDFLRLNDPDMAEADVQLIWDAIALHTTASIAWYKEPEVAATSYGVMADYFGPDLLGGKVITKDEWKEVIAAFPNTGFADSVRGIMCALCKSKPQTTYDNLLAGFGEDYVAGYKVKGNRLVDHLEAGLDKLKTMD